MISCDQHDYIEIACMYRMEITLKLKNGESILGRAVDTARNEHRQECIEIETENGKTLVVLEELSLISANQKNPHFESVEFSS